MKKLVTLLVLVIISTSCLAQKSELKAAEKSMDSNQYTETLTALKPLESTIGSAKIKYQTNYYFLLGKANYANGTTPKNFKKAANAFNKVIALEKKGTKKYSNDVSALLNSMIQKVAKSALDDYNNAIELNKEEVSKEQAIPLFSKAANGFKQVYAISVQDTAFLPNAGLAHHFAGEYEKSIATYQRLLDIGYTGVATIYSAISTVNQNRVTYASKADMDKQVKLKLAIEPKVEVKKSQKNDFFKMIAKNYIALKDNDKALAAIKVAQNASPNDYGLLVDEANVYFAMGDNLKFKEKLEEAIEINPTDPLLHYNIGVMKMELNDNQGAIDSFKKAIDLDPNYSDAYNNIGAAILTKAVPIVEEMNNSLSDFAKYDRLQAKQFDIYKEALPFYEKAFSFDKSNISTVRTLLGIYENLEMTEKLKELKAIYETLKQ